MFAFISGYLAYNTENLIVQDETFWLRGDTKVFSFITVT